MPALDDAAITDCVFLLDVDVVVLDEAEGLSVCQAFNLAYSHSVRQFFTLVCDIVAVDKVIRLVSLFRLIELLKLDDCRRFRAIYHAPGLILRVRALKLELLHSLRNILVGYNLIFISLSRLSPLLLSHSPYRLLFNRAALWTL